MYLLKLPPECLILVVRPLFIGSLVDLFMPAILFFTNTNEQNVTLSDFYNLLSVDFDLSQASLMPLLPTYLFLQEFYYIPKCFTPPVIEAGDMARRLFQQLKWVDWLRFEAYLLLLEFAFTVGFIFLYIALELLFPLYYPNGSASVDISISYWPV